MKKRFTNTTTQAKIYEAVLIAEKLLDASSPMMYEIRLKNDFKYDSGKGADIFLNLLKERPLIKVFTYKPWNRFSKAIGYSDGVSIHINIRKLPSMDVLDVVGNLVHEMCHVAGYSHGNNFKTEEKCISSVPYWCSTWIEKNHGKF
jgi:hypothetical protein